MPPAARSPSRLLAASLALGLLAGGHAAMAADRFVIVAPTAGSEFHEAVAEGCRVAAAKLGGVECTMLAPGPNEPRSQGRIIADLVAEKVAGLAVSPASLSDVQPAVAAARAAGIPVVAYDADLPAATRDAFVGSDARDFGRALGASLKRWRPTGGLYAVITGDAASPVLVDRLAGVRDALGGDWREIPASPIATAAEARVAAQAVDRVILEHPELDAVVSIGAWPLLDETAWREIAGRHKERLDRAKPILVVADALPLEKRLVRDGLAHVLVGQRPAEMGTRIAEMLAARRRGKPIAEIVYVGFDVFTRRDLLAKPD